MSSSTGNRYSSSRPCTCPRIRSTRTCLLMLAIATAAASAIIAYAGRTAFNRPVASKSRPAFERNLQDRVRRALRAERDPGATIIYVDADATTNGDGASWITAYRDLQDGLAAAAALNGQSAEIWVAEGVYTPDRGTGDHLLSFELIDSTGVYGGFVGGETDFDERDCRIHQTILSGDLAGNDVGTLGIEENAYHVLVSDAASESSVLDGFTIVAGNAISGRGGGLDCSDSAALVRNCNFTVNRGGTGGAIYSRGGNPTIVNCTFSYNTAMNGGGAVYCSGGAPVFINVLFWHNRADRGGAVFCDGSTGARGSPGVVYPALINCTLGDNQALTQGGGVFATGEGVASSYNSVFWGNLASQGSVESQQINIEGLASVLAYSCIQGWTGTIAESGNTSADPSFVDPADSDYRLAAPSSAIDSGNNSFLPVDIQRDLDDAYRFTNHPTSPDNGVSTNGLPLVDMGAFEWQPVDCNSNGILDQLDVTGGTSVDINANDIPDECDPDCDSNGLPDDRDLILGNHPDCNANSVPDACDIATGVSPDCNGNVVPDECDPDCNANAIPDDCDLVAGSATDCDSTGIPDTCEITPGLLRHPPSYPQAFNLNATSDQGADYRPQIVTDGTGTWIAVWYSLDDFGGTVGTDRDLIISRSDDNGVNWTFPQPLNSNADADSGDDYRPQIATDGEGNWMVVWESYDDLGGLLTEDPDILIITSQDDGITWTAPAPLKANAHFDTGWDFAPQLAVDLSGTWIVIWDSEDDLNGPINYDHDILISRSSDHGLSWTTPVPLNVNATTDYGDDTVPQLTISPLGTWVAAWMSSDSLEGAIGSDEDILFARSQDGGLTWSNPAPLNLNADSDIGADYDVQLAADAGGNWIATWVSKDDLGGTVGTDFDVLIARSEDDGQTWTAPTALANYAITDYSYDNWPQVVTDASGNWIIVWASAANPLGRNRIMFSYALDAEGRAWSDPVDFNSSPYNSGFDYFPQVATDGRGSWIALWESTNRLGGSLGSDYDLLFSRALLTTSGDCNFNGRHDVCDLRYRQSNDCNSNGLPDECDADCNMDGVPDACEVFGDMNHDEYLTDADIEDLLACLTSPCTDPPCVPTLYSSPCCITADADEDGDVDLADYGRIQAMFNNVCDTDAECDDGKYCTGAEVCGASGVCEQGPSACELNEWCYESNETCMTYGNGDFEPDGDVDLQDFGAFMRCYAGLGFGNCQAGNLTGDGTIDLNDFEQFVLILTGP